MKRTTLPCGAIVKPIFGIHAQEIRDLLSCAFEGGSNYWYEIKEYINPDSLVCEQSYMELPLIEGCGVLVGTDEDDGVDPSLLNRVSLERGLRLMRKDYRKHWEDFKESNYDSETGDVALQLSLFGEIVFA